MYSSVQNKPETIPCIQTDTFMKQITLERRIGIVQGEDPNYFKLNLNIGD